MSQRPDIPHIHGAEEYDRLTEHLEKTHVPVADAIDRFIQAIGRVIWWANGLLIAVIIAQVVLRYGFGRGLVVFEELQWHLYALAVMMGVSFALTNDAHIRVDVFVRMLESYCWHLVYTVCDDGSLFICTNPRLDPQVNKPAQDVRRIAF